MVGISKSVDGVKVIAQQTGRFGCCAVLWSSVAAGRYETSAEWSLWSRC